MIRVVDFHSLRADWYANANFMARMLQRQLRSPSPIVEFRNFPRHWLPAFEWAGAKWDRSVEPTSYIPFLSGLSEQELVREIDRARAAGQLRLLVEVAASTEVVLCETLQRIDAVGRPIPSVQTDREIRLTTWHSYNRPDVRAFDLTLAGYTQKNKSVLFLPCSKARPYHKSQTHRRLLTVARNSGLDVDRMDKIVITSIGPVPEELWNDPFIKNYDTGVRDLYRLFVQLRCLLRGTRYLEAWDLMPFVPYSDLIGLLHQEGYLPVPQRLPNWRRRNIPAYRPIGVTENGNRPLS